jgi:hypothetical protein
MNIISKSQAIYWTPLQVKTGKMCSCQQVCLKSYDLKMETYFNYLILLIQLIDLIFIMLLTYTLFLTLTCYLIQQYILNS